MPSKILLLAFFSLLLFGCSKRLITTPITLSETLDVELIEFDYLDGKGKISYSDEKGERVVRTNIRVRKDSVIWINFSVIGVQGGRVLINQDSITLINNLDKEYFTFTYEELSKRFNFNINYHVIQAAMLGNPILPRKPGDLVQRQSGFFLLQQESESVSVKNFINAATDKLERVELVEANSNNTVKIYYANFQPLEDKYFPYNGIINLVYKNEVGLIKNNITFEYTKAELGDKELNFPFNIPKKYERR